VTAAGFPADFTGDSWALAVMAVVAVYSAADGTVRTLTVPMPGGGLAVTAVLDSRTVIFSRGQGSCADDHYGPVRGGGNRCGPDDGTGNNAINR
jgi:hypothetical protein